MLTEADIRSEGGQPEQPKKKEPKRIRRARERKRLGDIKCETERCEHKEVDHRRMEIAGKWCFRCNNICPDERTEAWRKRTKRSSAAGSLT